MPMWSGGIRRLNYSEARCNRGMIAQPRSWLIEGEKNISKGAELYEETRPNKDERLGNS